MMCVPVRLCDSCGCQPMVGAQMNQRLWMDYYFFFFCGVNRKAKSVFWCDLTWEFSSHHKHDEEAMSSVFGECVMC